MVLGIVPAPAFADATRDEQWYLRFLKIADAHRVATGEGVRIAVIDTGVEARHPDLQGSVVPGTNVGSEGGDGLSDFRGHGTWITGLVAARGRPDDQGILGIAPGAVAVPVVPGSTLNARVPEAIDWAVDNGAKVICIALAGDASGRMKSAVDRALAADAVIVAGTGNERAARIGAPALYPGVIAAVGVDRAGNRASFSTAGPEAVLAAPGVDIVTTDRGGGYAHTEGTSMSTAIIAGVAALVRSKYPDLSASEVVHRMTATAVDRGQPGRDDEYGYGIVDPVAALTADVAPEGGSAGGRGSWFTGDVALVVMIVGGALVLALGVVLVIRRTTGGRTRDRPAP